MTPHDLARQLAATPGLIEPPAVRHGAWRLRARADALPEMMRWLLGELHGALWLVAGEDRHHLGEMRVHYLVGFAVSRGSDPSVLTLTRGQTPAAASVVHVEVMLDRDRPEVPTLSALSFPASRFEREMRDLLGITPLGHPDPRPLVRHGFWPETFHPLRQDAVVPAFEDDGQPFPFTSVEGEGVYEIPVGPVHAGVIEPGHFRFNVLGETILKMRARLYFTHKGTEKLFEGRTPEDGVALAERISGDTSVGHALAYCQAVEALAGTEVPERARLLRTVLLELERLYNHVTDVGAIVADTGFAIGQAHCLRLREDLLRLNKRLTRHRLLRGSLVPGGVAGIVMPDRQMVDQVTRVVTDFDEVTAICLENTLVRDRLDATGRLPPEVARDFGVVGYVARACGLPQDVRADVPFAAYDRLRVSAVVEQDGDVSARLRVRVREARQSLALVDEAVGLLASADSALRTPLGEMATFTPGIGVVEAWRGRLVHLVIAGALGRLWRVKVVDPSFFNWPALARTLEDNIVPDFPLCNKSFNQSYSGNDL
jgi:Ni,Fe-hydrogenase III large subunit/Ni,Fe-hydrogenase III component G